MILGRSVTWSSSDTTVAFVDATGLVTAVRADSAPRDRVTITARAGGQVASSHLTVAFSRMPVRGLYITFDRRGTIAGYYSRQFLQAYDSVDAITGVTAAAEAASQLDAMKALGVNTVTFEFRATDAAWINDGFTPPTCNIPPVLGMRRPQPTAQELTNVQRFFDLLQSKGMRVLMRLVSTHMEESPPTRSTTWLGAILGALGNHPALELVSFEGDQITYDTNGDGVPDRCGFPAEPPLWLGPNSISARYVTWAIGYARFLGMPARRLSTEAIVGDYRTMHGLTGLADPLVVEKGIFDALSIPDSARTYFISFYEHRKCAEVTTVVCTDAGPDAWADSTLRHVFAVIGRRSRARVIAGEMGTGSPQEPGGSASQALASLAYRLRSRGADGGCFWRWVSYATSGDSDPTLADPIKRRGLANVYNPVKDVMAAVYAIP